MTTKHARIVLVILLLAAASLACITTGGGSGAAYHQPAEATVSLGSALAWLIFLIGALSLVVALSEIGWI